MRASVAAAALLATVATAGGCANDSPPSSSSSRGPSPTSATQAGGSSPGQLPDVPQRPARPARPFRHRIAGMPPSRGNQVYAATRPGLVSARLRHEPAYLYVPNSYGAPITTVISQRTHRVVRVLRTGALSQHVTPSYDLRRLYVEASAANRIDEIDPHTARIVHRYHVDRPYNLYFTPDGRYAVVMDEEHQRINFTDPRTFRVHRSVTDPSCSGPNHADFSANGRFFLVTCEFSGSLLRVSTLGQRVTGRLDLGPGSKPQDVRLAPDGRSFYVADMGRDQLDQIPWNRLRVARRVPTPAMPHGLYPSRDERSLYISDRMAGKVSVFSFARHRIVDTWPIPGGGTPDMGGISADGKTLWLSGRSTGYVYGWDTRTGRLIARIYVGGSPHGILVWPQPGRYSLGHTGNLR
jgi:DNA-binding beta-propeller fold protein YncE